MARYEVAVRLAGEPMPLNVEAAGVPTLGWCANATKTHFLSANRFSRLLTASAAIRPDMSPAPP